MQRWSFVYTARERNKKQEQPLLEELRAEPRTLIANKVGDSRLRTSYDYMTLYIYICYPPPHVPTFLAVFSLNDGISIGMISHLR